MDERTLTALKGSISKWEEIVAGTGLDRGGKNCPLCKLFCNEETEDACLGCPVAERVDMAGCLRTPYSDWVKGCDPLTFPRRPETEEQFRLAQAELDFLRSLLPVEATADHQG